MRGCVFRVCRLVTGLLMVAALCATAPVHAGKAITHVVGAARPLVIAHRGASGVAPENTMASFEQAIRFGADMIELDVHGSKDGYLIVIHDASTSRTAKGNCQGAVANLTLVQLKALDVGVWKDSGFAGERMPTLDEVLAAFKERALFLIELKARGIEERVAQVIHEAGMEGRVMLQSFDAESVRIMRGLLPETPAGILYRDTWVLDPAGRGRRIVEQVLEVGASFAGMNVGAVSAELVKVLNSSGIDVFAWTADDDWVFTHLIQAGVDGIITNYPERLLRHLGRRVGE
ncbi:MAG TPA: glycerophosphodiester phosphodiesterase family protein [Bacillota bacterium]|nr:glycerophosphodiester phosphodiesterase family protein [Bacillota bacterium]